MAFFQFLLRRFVWATVTLLMVYTISFFLMRSVSGGPFDSEKQLPEAQKRNVEARYQFDKPLIVQYTSHLLKMMKGDFGPSYRLLDFNVNEIIGNGFPVSASLGILALLFALALGTTAGIVSAVYRHSVFDFTFMAIATIGIAVPNFVLAGLLIMVIVFGLGWFPSAGWGTVRQLVLPVICLGALFAGYIARLTRTGMLEVLGLDYIRTAYAKGLMTRRVILRHALRGAILPVVSYLGPASAGILTGSIVVEKIFFIPGLGSHFVEAVIQRDYTLSSGLVMIYAVILVTMNTLVDISYVFIDPRVKLK